MDYKKERKTSLGIQLPIKYKPDEKERDTGTPTPNKLFESKWRGALGIVWYVTRNTNVLGRCRIIILRTSIRFHNLCIFAENAQSICMFIQKVLFGPARPGCARPYKTNSIPYIPGVSGASGPIPLKKSCM